MKPAKDSDTSEHRNICKHITFKVHVHVFLCHAQHTLQNFESLSKPMLDTPAIPLSRPTEPPTHDMTQTGHETIPRAPTVISTKGRPHTNQPHQQLVTEDSQGLRKPRAAKQAFGSACSKSEHSHMMDNMIIPFSSGQRNAE
ncbi:hypothetical protein WISP_125258 [Willisornis vidua]|uniref:Uncharacterized protein n=1 Tax=Willisornis vidua TaxID=1566151 RepID=A0ABQ9CX94_9PASS|nr:hypothetical protein WISP_125258 [Willisornis vidua]